MCNLLCRALGGFFLSAILLSGLVPDADAGFQYLEAPFLQVNQRGDSEESIRGILHFIPARGRLILEVIDPISQWIVVDSAQTSLYYPDEGKTIHLEGSGISPYQVFTTFWEGTALEACLSPPGFEPCSTVVRGDSLESWWKPGTGVGDERVRLRWIFFDDLPVRFEIYDEDRRIAEVIRFDGYVECGGNRIPLEIVSEQLTGEFVRERIVFSTPTLSTDVPPRIRDFTIPDTEQ